MAQSTHGVLVNYRIGPKTQASRECIVQFGHIDTIAEAGKLIGRKIAWKGGKNTIIGKIVALHGRNGMVRARFRRGVPGQALGSIVELIT